MRRGTTHPRVAYSVCWLSLGKWWQLWNALPENLSARLKAPQTVMLSVNSKLAMAVAVTTTTPSPPPIVKKAAKQAGRVTSKTVKEARICSFESQRDLSWRFLWTAFIYYCIWNKTWKPNMSFAKLTKYCFFTILKNYWWNYYDELSKSTTSHWTVCWYL